MANEQDFKKLLETQKETNKQLALLRQQQMEIAKDPPEKFTEGEEFKATALHIASERLSGMHETDDEVKKLREEIKEDNKTLVTTENKNTEKSIDHLETLVRNKDSIFIPQRQLEAIKELKENFVGSIKGLKENTVGVLKTLTLRDNQLRNAVDAYSRPIIRQEKDKIKREKQLEKSQKNMLGMFSPKKLAVALAGPLGEGLSDAEKKQKIQDAVREREKQKKEGNIFGKLLTALSPKNLLGGLFKGVGTLFKGAGLAAKGFFAAIFTGLALIGLGVFVKNIPKILETLKSNIGEMGDEFKKIALAIGVGAGVGIVAKLVGFTLATGPVGLLALAVVGLGLGIAALANSLTNISVDTITEEEKLRKEYAKSKRKIRTQKVSASSKVKMSKQQLDDEQKRLQKIEKRAKELGIDLEKPYVEPVPLPKGIDRTTARMGDDGKYYVTQTPKKVGGHAGRHQDMRPKEIKIEKEQYDLIMEQERVRIEKMGEKIEDVKKQERKIEQNLRDEQESLTTTESAKESEMVVANANNINAPNISNVTNNTVTSSHIRPLDSFLIQASMMEF